LNQNGTGWNNQLNRNPENVAKFEEFEELYKNDPWWKEMKHRIDNKTPNEIDLDRRLFEQVGSGVKDPVF